MLLMPVYVGREEAERIEARGNRKYVFRVYVCVLVGRADFYSDAIYSTIVRKRRKLRKTENIPSCPVDRGSIIKVSRNVHVIFVYNATILCISVYISRISGRNTRIVTKYARKLLICRRVNSKSNAKSSDALLPVKHGH